MYYNRHTTRCTWGIENVERKPTEYPNANRYHRFHLPHATAFDLQWRPGFIHRRWWRQTRSLRSRSGVLQPFASLEKTNGNRVQRSSTEASVTHDLFGQHRKGAACSHEGEVQLEGVREGRWGGNAHKSSKIMLVFGERKDELRKKHQQGAEVVLFPKCSFYKCIAIDFKVFY